jgi:hypothetical protein
MTAHAAITSQNFFGASARLTVGVIGSKRTCSKPHGEGGGQHCQGRNTEEAAQPPRKDYGDKSEREQANRTIVRAAIVKRLSKRLQWVESGH